MAKTIIGIRCVNYDKNTQRIYKIIHDIFPKYDILFFSDSLNRESDDFPDDVNVFKITKDVLSKAELSYSDKKTSWKAGDYAYCLALMYEWDYMWLIEPDIFISQDNYELFRNIDKSKVDLIASVYAEQDKTWFWGDVIKKVTDFDKVFGAFFPLTRLSRRLAEEVYEERKKISEIIDRNKNLEFPNDESVVGCVTYSKEMSALVLKDEYDKQFKHFDWDVDYKYEDIALKSGIFHSVDKPKKKLYLRLKDFVKTSVLRR